MSHAEERHSQDLASAPVRDRNSVFDLRDYYRLTFDGRKIRCYLRLVDPARLGGAASTPAELVEAIEAECERRGIQHPEREVIRATVQSPQYGEDVLIAEGREAVPGRDGIITYKFRTDLDKVRLVEDEETGRVDFRELGLIDNVRAGDVLATATKPTPGRPGVDVFGKPVRPVPGQAARIRVGSNVTLSDDGRTATAAIDGYVDLDNMIIRVSPVYLVRGDVNFGVGNIRFNGTVRILGSVLEDFKVQADGDIIVEGDVEKASLQAGGGVFVRGSILGKDDAMVRAGQDIVARFAVNGRLHAERDVRIAEELVNSKVFAGSSIRLEGVKRRVMGGSLTARNEIRVGTIGSENGLAITRLELVVQPELLTQAEEREARRGDLELQCAQRESALAKLLALKEKMGRLTSEQITQVRTLMEEVQALREEQSDLAREAAEFRQTFANQQAARIVVDDVCYPGTTLNIHGVEAKLNEPVRAATFELRDDSLVAA